MRISLNDYFGLLYHRNPWRARYLFDSFDYDTTQLHFNNDGGTNRMQRLLIVCLPIPEIILRLRSKFFSCGKLFR